MTNEPHDLCQIGVFKTSKDGVDNGGCFPSLVKDKQVVIAFVSLLAVLRPERLVVVDDVRSVRPVLQIGAAGCGGFHW